MIAIARLALLSTALATLQGTDVKLKEEKPGLLKKAKVTFEVAKTTAQAKVPGGVLISAELEQEGGKLIYTLVYKTAGKKGQDEVNVDAVTGTVAPTEHEADEADAKKAPAKASTKAPATAPAKAPAKAPTKP